MTWLIVLFVAAILLGGLAHALPPKSERIRNRIKEQALAQGFILYSRKVPCGTIEGRVHGDQYLRTFYARKGQLDWDLPDFLVYRTTGAQGNYLPEGWDWSDEQYHRELSDLLSPFLLQLDARFAAVAFDQQRGLALHWREDLQQSNIDSLIQASEQLLKLSWPIVRQEKQTPG